MAKQNINVGTAANDKKGDSLRAAFVKVNANFTELYTELGLVVDANLNLGAFEFAGSTISTTDSTAIVIDQAATVTSNLSVGGDLLPQTANGGDLGSSTLPWRSLYVSTNTIFLGGVSLSLDASNNLTVNGSRVGTTSYADLTNTPTGFSSLVNDTKTVSLASTGVLTLANTARLQDNASGAISLGITASGFATAQGAGAIAIGQNAGGEYQSDNTVAVGYYAGSARQGFSSVAVGRQAGQIDQGVQAVSIGLQAGNSLQGMFGVAIGPSAGETSQGASAVAIGQGAGATNQAANTIILNATGSAVNGVAAQTNSFYVAPIRNAISSSGLLQYNAATKEVTYSSDIRSEGNVTIEINLSDSTLRRWQFGEDGLLTFPDGTSQSTAGGGGGSTLVNGAYTVSLGSTGTLTFPTLTVPIEDNANPVGTGQVLKFSDSTQQAIIFGPESTVDYPAAQRIIIQGAPGYTGTAGEGGDVYVWAGPGGSVNGNGGDIKVRAGQGNGSGNGGYLNFQAGDSGATSYGGYINIESGSSNTAGQGGDITIRARSGGNIDLYTTDSAIRLNTNGGTWSFAADDTLTLPNGGTITEGGGISGAIKLTPSGGANVYQALLIYPTGNAEGDHIHLTAAGGTTELYLGSDNHYVKLASGGVVRIQADNGVNSSAAWTFDTAGNIDTQQALGIKVPDGVPSSVTAITMTTASWELNPRSNLATTGGSGTGLTVNITETSGYASAIAIAAAGTGYTAGDVITVTSGTSSAAFIIAVAGRNTWQFGEDGSLTFPDNTVQTTAAESFSFSVAADDSTQRAISNNELIKFIGAGTVTTASDAEGNITITGTVPSTLVNSTKTLSLGSDGSLTSNGALTLKTPNGIPTSVSNWQGQGGWNQNTYTNLATTGGTGTGLTVDVAANGAGYILIGAITINTPGTGYTAGDVITIDNENSLPGTFTIGVAGTRSWAFGINGGVTFPDATVQTTAYTGAGAALPVCVINSSSNSVGGIVGGVSVNFTVTNPSGAAISEIGIFLPSVTTAAAATVADSAAAGTQAKIITAPAGNTRYWAQIYAVTANGTAYSAPNYLTATHICLLAGTMISMADGTYKAIEDITYTDRMLSWDFDRGCYAETTALWIKQAETGSQYNLLTFSDGTTLRTFDQHRIFNKQAGAFTYPMTDATPIGTITVNEHGEEITLISKQVVVDTIEYYNVITDHHMNLFSDTVLTSCRFNNIYPILDMKFVKDSRTLRTRDEFENIPDRFFYGLRLAEQTFDLDMIEWYVTRLLSVEQSFELALV